MNYTTDQIKDYLTECQGYEVEDFESYDLVDLKAFIYDRGWEEEIKGYYK